VSGCPVLAPHQPTTHQPTTHQPTAPRPKTNHDWWPNQPDLRPLRKHAPQPGPYGRDFDYPAEFASLDVEALKRDVIEVMTTSQDWWPADYGHYGPLFVRLSWHAAGTYRISDGRGGGSRGAQRFASLGSWPDNVSLDKARRLLWPVKQKYGRKISWADLIVFAGNCAYEAMGFTTFGFGFGRDDSWEPDETFWGPEDSWLGDDRYTGDRELAQPFGASQLGLIYVNPEGPDGIPDPLAAARDVRETFHRMAMNDEETLALIVGGHTVGKAHGAASPDHLGPAPEAAPIEQQGLGWHSGYGTGSGADTIATGLEGAWTSEPTRWSSEFLENLLDYDWQLVKSPGGAWEWIPDDPRAQDTVPDAHDPATRRSPMMLTTDIALKVDPVYRPIAERFRNNPDELARVFAETWYKLLHRDMGPVTRFLGPWVAEPQLWQDPVPPVDHDLVDEQDIAALKAGILASGLSGPALVSTAWAAAASFRGTDLRGGANGARIRLEPQRNWEVNNPAQLSLVLTGLEQVQKNFNHAQAGAKQVSLADLIVLGGCAAVEQAARRAGHDVAVPFRPGRTDTSQEQTHVVSFAVLEPTADGFRNYVQAGQRRPPEVLLVDRADLLTLTPAEMTVLVGGMRVLNANFRQSPLGVLTDRPETLTNDFFVNLLDMGTKWAASPSADGEFNGRRRATGELRWTATAVDLVFGANSELRAIAEVYASADAEGQFVRDFVAAWDKVMNLDRFDLA
jgi:catalase-peroxidase